MYCSNCGTPITATLSFCNRCGADLRESVQTSNTGPIIAFLSAMTVIGIAGMGLIVGGAIALRKEAGLPPDLIAFFMLFSFLIVVLTEILLVRNLSRLMHTSVTKKNLPNVPVPPLELRQAAASGFADPVGSVTDNTTRTLEYAPRER